MNGYQAKRITEAVEQGLAVTAWERDFIASLSGMGKEEELTEAQNHELNRICQRAK